MQPASDYALQEQPQYYHEEPQTDEEIKQKIPPIVRSAELDQEIVEAVDEYIEYKLQRKAINADMQAVVERMETKGIPRAAFKATVKKMEYTEDQRKVYDNAMMVTCSAVGIPIQTDMFD